MVYETKDGVEKSLDYFCACSKCFQVYQYKDCNGKHFGTKNQIEHARRHAGIVRSQMTLMQCLPCQVQFSAADNSTLKKREMHYCVDGYHSFKSVEHAGLLKLMQSCAHLGAKYGKFDVSEAICGRKTVSREATVTASSVKASLTERLKESQQDVRCLKKLKLNSCGKP